jgi:hypothetical protein
MNMSNIDRPHDYQDIVDVFQNFNTQARLGISPCEAAEILMEPVELQVAFKGVEHFLDRQLVVLDTIAQQRDGYDGIDFNELGERLTPLLVARRLFEGEK